MKSKLILCLALVLSGVLAFFGFNYFFWSWSRNHPWTQVSEIWVYPSKDRLVRENHFVSGFPRSILQNSKLFIQWSNGQKELLASTEHYRTVNHCTLSADGDRDVIGVGGITYYRQKTSSTNQWNSWTLAGSPEIYSFIKNYLDAHSPGSYAPDTNEFAPAGAFEIRCNRMGEEQPLVIAAYGDSPYEIAAIRDHGRELMAAPFASNPFAPQLIFSQDGNFGGWKFDEHLTTAENKNHN